jgi:hypothetical protein
MQRSYFVFRLLSVEIRAFLKNSCAFAIRHNVRNTLPQIRSSLTGDEDQITGGVVMSLTGGRANEIAVG